MNINVKYKIRDVAVDFLTFDESYKSIRERSDYQGFSCFKCEQPFEIGDKMGLLMMHKHLNRVLCRKCAMKIQRGLKNEQNLG